MQRKQEADAEIAAKRKEKRVDDSRYALRKQMAIEESERQHIDDLKKAEKEAAEADVYSALSKFDPSAAPATPAPAPAPMPEVDLTPKPEFEAVSSEDDTDDDTSGAGKAATRRTAAPKTKPKAAPAPASSEPVYESPAAAARARKAAAAAEAALAAEEDTAGAEEEEEEKKKKAIFDGQAGPRPGGADDDDEEDIVFVPPPRDTSKIQLKFTPRAFPTPARESTLREEEDWLAKNRRFIDKKGPMAGKGDISERDPLWLKGKGDDFYRSGDFHGALNAYTAALDIDDSILACVSNRSACHLHLGLLEPCLKDVDRALELLAATPASEDRPAPPSPTPGLSKHQKMRLRLTARKGTALAGAGRYEEAVKEFQAAGDLDRQDPTYSTMVSRVSKLMTYTSWKAAGDGSFRAGNHAEAIAAFDRVLAAEPRFVAALSNRAAAHLVTENYEQCVDDCTLALGLLGIDVGAELDVPKPEMGTLDAVPPQGSARHKDFALKTHIRRATALSKLGRHTSAVTSLEAAVRLDGGKNADLRKQLLRARARAKTSPSDL